MDKINDLFGMSNVTQFCSLFKAFNREIAPTNTNFILDHLTRD